MAEAMGGDNENFSTAINQLANKEKKQETIDFDGLRREDNESITTAAHNQLQNLKIGLTHKSDDGLDTFTDLRNIKSANDAIYEYENNINETPAIKITLIQIALKDSSVGNMVGKIDAMWGPKMDAAWRQFRKNNPNTTSAINLKNGDPKALDKMMKQIKASFEKAGKYKISNRAKNKVDEAEKNELYELQENGDTATLENLMSYYNATKLSTGKKFTKKQQTAFIQKMLSFSKGSHYAGEINGKSSPAVESALNSFIKKNSNMKNVNKNDFDALVTAMNKAFEDTQK